MRKDKKSLDFYTFSKSLALLFKEKISNRTGRIFNIETDCSDNDLSYEGTPTALYSLYNLPLQETESVLNLLDRECCREYEVRNSRNGEFVRIRKQRGEEIKTFNNKKDIDKILAENLGLGNSKS